MDDLTKTELAMLDLERGWFAHGGARASEIRRRFGISEAVYSLRLNALIETAGAEAFDPVLVRRLRRLRDGRRAARRAS